MWVFNTSVWRMLATGSLGVAIVIMTACQQTSTTLSEQPEKTATAQAASVGINELAPDFSGIDSNGVTHNLKDFRGTTVVLEWTNHQCPFTGKHYSSGNMQALQAEATEQGIVWLSIVSSAPRQQGYVTAAEAKQITTDQKAQPTAVILDPTGEIGRLYSARTTPHMYVIDPEGTLRYMGGIDNIPSADPADIASATNYVQGALTSLSSGQPIDPNVTQPYGCSVKYDINL
jgi:peroxiredoxin